MMPQSQDHDLNLRTFRRWRVASSSPDIQNADPHRSCNTRKWIFLTSSSVIVLDNIHFTRLVVQAMPRQCPTTLRVGGLLLLAHCQPVGYCIIMAVSMNISASLLTRFEPDNIHARRGREELEGLALRLARHASYCQMSLHRHIGGPSARGKFPEGEAEGNRVLKVSRGAGGGSPLLKLPSMLLLAPWPLT